MKDKAKLENKNKSKKEYVKKSKKIHVNKKKFIKRMGSILITKNTENKVKNKFKISTTKEKRKCQIMKIFQNMIS